MFCGFTWFKKPEYPQDPHGDARDRTYATAVASEGFTPVLNNQLPPVVLWSVGAVLRPSYHCQPFFLHNPSMNLRHQELETKQHTSYHNQKHMAHISKQLETLNSAF